MTRVALAAVGALTLLAAGCGGRASVPSFGSNIDLTRAYGTDGEVSAAIDPKNPATLLAGSIGYSFREMRSDASETGGVAWSKSLIAPQALNACYADPAVAIASDGRQYYAYIQHPCRGREEEGEIVIRTRASAASRWSSPTRVAPRIKGDTADRPVLTVDDNASSVRHGRLWLAWTDYVNGRFSAAYIARSDDDGRHWSKPLTPPEGGYEPSLAVTRDGRVIEASVDYGRGSVVLASPGGNGFVRSIEATQGKRHWCSDTDFLVAMPHRHVCATPSAAIDQSRGTLYVAWSGETKAGLEQVYVRRFSISALADKKPAAQLPRPLPGSAGHDEFHPTATVDQRTGAIWVCFYKTEGESRQRARFVCDVSKDGGAAWTQLIAARTASNETTWFASPFGYGDYESVVADDGVAHPFWTASIGYGFQDDVFTTALRQP